MPFVAMNAPVTFQRLMDDRVLERSNSAPMFGLYVDDLLIFAKSFDKSSRTPRKCFSVRFLHLHQTYVVSGITKWITKALTLGAKEGTRPSQRKVQALVKLRPETLESFLFSINY